MSSAASGGTLDLDALRRGMEGRDLEAILGMYADDAEISIVDQAAHAQQSADPAWPDQIRAFLSDVIQPGHKPPT